MLSTATSSFSYNHRETRDRGGMGDRETRERRGVADSAPGGRGYVSSLGRGGAVGAKPQLQQPVRLDAVLGRWRRSSVCPSVCLSPDPGGSSRRHGSRWKAARRPAPCTRRVLTLAPRLPPRAGRQPYRGRGHWQSSASRYTVTIAAADTNAITAKPVLTLTHTSSWPRRWYLP